MNGNGSSKGWCSLNAKKVTHLICQGHITQDAHARQAIWRNHECTALSAWRIESVARSRQRLG